MQIYKFYQVLNDLYSYFLLADIEVLQSYQVQNQLSEDLATEFTTNTTGDEVVLEGIMIPLANIENYPYTNIFNLTTDIEMLRPNNELQICQKNYGLKVESGKIHLFTWRVLQRFDNEHIQPLLQLKPNLSLENGWYQVDIYAGQSWQTLEQGSESTLEPTIEFALTKMMNKPTCQADIFASYHIESDSY